MSVRLRIRFKASTHALTVDASTSFLELRALIESLTQISAFQQRLLAGYPPHELNGSDDASIASLGIKSGETIILEELPVSHVHASSALLSTSAPAVNHNRNNANGTVVRRVIASDNSCLFNAFGYVFSRDKQAASELRSLIAAVVMSDPDTYNDAMLGMTNQAYCNFIMSPDRWGGAIELSILAANFGVEICAIDIKTQIPYMFGENAGYPNRVYLLYGGIHYDALALAPSASENDDVTVFAANDHHMLQRALDLAKELAKVHR
jgi:ubiquitin thioesterase OTU1